MQTIIKTHLPGYSGQHQLNPRQRQVCHHIRHCRTAQMGTAQLACTECEQTRLQHFACRDRHCPKCQHQASRQWSEKQLESLLPVTYHHLVFTLPHELNGWVGLHPKEIYGLFFQSVWSTLKRFGENPKYLGGQIGMTGVLHTWGENLMRHVHLHCLIPGGALSNSGDWIDGRGDYLFPVRALSRRFRGCMVSSLRQSATAGKFHRVTTPGQIDQVLNQLMSKEWAVYSLPCPGRAERVVQYLARYTHRIAISDQRIERVDSHSVRFSTKDYRSGGKRKSLTLEADEFIRRFLLHVLPKGLMRIRHYGLLSNRNRRDKIERIRQWLSQPKEPVRQEKKSPSPEVRSGATYTCGKCLTGRMVIVRSIGKGPPIPTRF